MNDLFEKCYQYRRVDEAKALGIYPYFRTLNSRQDTEVMMEGKRRIMLGSNNYLGLTCDPRVQEAAIKAVERYGTGCSGSRFLNGTLDLHVQLEQSLADFLKKEEAVVFSTGFQTNLSIISAITGRNDVILSDSMNHASIVDGTRLSFARTVKFRHSDMEDLEKKLQRFSTEISGGILIVSDGVFSMEGEICNLPGLVALAKQYGARLLIDDAHGLGVLGEHGRGTAEHFGLENEVDLIMNTFSKTLASLGGCVVGESKIVEYIRHTARPFIFSASVPPAQLAAAAEALAILRQEPWRTKRLHEITHQVKMRLKAMPVIQLYESGNDCVPIIPILIGNTLKTLYTGMRLYDAGVYVNPVMPPAVAETSCLLRTSYTATHTDDQLDEALEIMERVLTSIEEDDAELQQLMAIGQMQQAETAESEN